MYVIFPAQEVVEYSYNWPLTSNPGQLPRQVQPQQPVQLHQQATLVAATTVTTTVTATTSKQYQQVRFDLYSSSFGPVPPARRRSRRKSSITEITGAPVASSPVTPTTPVSPSSATPSTLKNFIFGSILTNKMTSEGQASLLREMTHPALNEAFKAQNNTTFKLVKTVADFTQQLASIHEQHAEELQLLVETFRKRNAELRRERPLYQSSLYTSWEGFLQEVEVDSQIHSDIASILGRHVSIPLLERTFYRKLQSRKVFTHRESYETILNKTEELLYKCHKDYVELYEKLLIDRSQANTDAYVDAHNAYVQQLHASNAMVEEYHNETLPQLLEELEEVYLDLSDTVARSVLVGAEIIANKAQEQNSRYDVLCSLSKSVNGRTDLGNYLRTFSVDRAPVDSVKHHFSPPHHPADSIDDGSHLPTLKDELVIEKNMTTPMRNKYENLRKEAAELDIKTRNLQEAQESLLRLQQRSLENSLFNKANEIQEDISMKRFDLRTAQIHIAAVRAQLDLLAHSLGDQQENMRERRLSATSTVSIKNKWLKAFSSLKKGSSSTSSSTDKKPEKNGNTSGASGRSSGDNSPAVLENAHIFQDYTYKKVTPCDLCHEILRGHSRQGMRCKMCKMNVHAECQDKVGKCQPKPRLLRRQKSTSEIETKVMERDDDKDDVDPVYQLLKQAGELTQKKGSIGSGGGDSGSGTSSLTSSISSLHVVGIQRPRLMGLGPNPRAIAPTTSPHTLGVSAYPAPSSCSENHSGARSKTMKFGTWHSTDASSSHSSEETATAGQPRPHSIHRMFPPSERPPQSPVHCRRLLNTKTVRMSSVDLPDENEKSLSSASTSPCPSPKPHRLLPTNLYVVLYQFKSRQQDELDLKAGYTVTVIDTSDPDWWKGKCLGRVGYFPSKYVAKLNPGERPLQVTHNLQVSGGENGLKLLRDQIVIQISEETDGMIPIRCGDRQGLCPVKYLQEV